MTKPKGYYRSRRKDGTMSKPRPITGKQRQSYRSPEVETYRIEHRKGLLEVIEEEDRKLARLREITRLKQEERIELERLYRLSRSSDAITRAQAKAEIERRFPAEYKHLFLEEPRPLAVIGVAPAVPVKPTEKQLSLYQKIKATAKELEKLRAVPEEFGIRERERRVRRLEVEKKLRALEAEHEKAVKDYAEKREREAEKARARKIIEKQRPKKETRKERADREAKEQEEAMEIVVKKG